MWAISCEWQFCQTAFFLWTSHGGISRQWCVCYVQSHEKQKFQVNNSCLLSLLLFQPYRCGWEPGMMVSERIFLLKPFTGSLNVLFISASWCIMADPNNGKGNLRAWWQASETLLPRISGIKYQLRTQICNLTCLTVNISVRNNDFVFGTLKILPFEKTHAINVKWLRVSKWKCKFLCSHMSRVKWNL